MAFRGLLQGARSLHRAPQLQGSPYLLGNSRSYSRVISSGCIFSLSHEDQNAPLLPRGSAMTLHSTKVTSWIWISDNCTLNLRDSVRSLATQVKPSAQARQRGAQISLFSPGFVYAPYTPREPIPFWKRWFTRSGWRRTKDDVILELKSAYAIAKLRRTGYTKQQFYLEAIDLYKKINFLVAHGDKKSLRKLVTEKMYSTLKNDIKQRTSMWSTVYWEMVEPAVKIRTLRARLIGVDKNDVNKVFVQLTLEFLTKQRFEAYDSNGKVVAGDKNKEILVRDIWVFEKSLFHTGAHWRLCGKIVL
ncbi:39S ribosomal protein L45, mitochondrial-like isoform X2 [Punica granatum]|uniref:Large ribosomal subunit protein mL45 n=1 Tax=Punica granatum TaxID=22663 RepID=A0A6P8E8L7_PUNGR|nr:39S ribosomal protein L45, mitochondrial-like isoform X2 [Punica granatum]